MTSPRTTTTRRVDASMTLLTEVMERPLDPGYAAAAARRASGQVAPPTVVGRVVTVVLLALVGVVGVVAVRTLREPNTDVLDAKTALLQRVQADTKAADNTQRANDALRLANDKAQANLLRLQAKGALAEQIQQLGMISGALSVTGPGVKITMNDAPSSQPTSDGDPRDQGDADQGRVVDRDIQTVVNGLWASGAEAISVNGQRLTALSAIRSAGSAILVDFRPLSPPYTISAIGDPGSLRADFADSAAGAYLAALSDNFGIDSSTTTVNAMTLPASSGLTLTEASPPPTATPTSSPHSSKKADKATPTSEATP